MILKILFLMAALPLAAAEPTALSLDWVLAETVRNNPEIKAAAAEVEAAKSMATAARAWMAPMVSLEWMPMDRRRLELTQTLPFPGRTLHAGSVATHAARRQQAMHRMAVEEKTYEARQAYWELAAAERALAAVGHTLEALKGMRRLSSNRAGFGNLDRMGQLMDTMLGMEAADMETMQPHWTQERVKAEARLNRLMGAPQGREIPPINLSLEEMQALSGKYSGDLARRVEKNNPQLEEARHHLEHSRAARTQARSAWLPDLMLQGAVEEDASGMRENSFMAGITLPGLWFWGIGGEVGAANAELKHSESNLSAASLRLNEQVYVQQKDLENSLEELEIVLGKMLPLSEQGLKQAVSGFGSGTVGANEALMAVKAYWMAEERLVHLIRHIGMSRAMLDMLMATTTSPKEMSHE